MADRTATKLQQLIGDLNTQLEVLKRKSTLPALQQMLEKLLTLLSSTLGTRDLEQKNKNVLRTQLKLIQVLQSILHELQESLQSCLDQVKQALQQQQASQQEWQQKRDFLRQNIATLERETRKQDSKMRNLDGQLDRLGPVMRDPRLEAQYSQCQQDYASLQYQLRLMKAQLEQLGQMPGDPKLSRFSELAQRVIQRAQRQQEQLAQLRIPSSPPSPPPPIPPGPPSGPPPPPQRQLFCACCGREYFVGRGRIDSGYCSSDCKLQSKLAIEREGKEQQKQVTTRKQHLQRLMQDLSNQIISLERQISSLGLPHRGQGVLQQQARQLKDRYKQHDTELQQLRRSAVQTQPSRGRRRKLCRASSSSSSGPSCDCDRRGMCSDSRHWQ